MIFDFEDTGEAPRPAESDLSVPSAPVRAPVRPTRNRNTTRGGLPESLSSLRPASLPVASNVRTAHQRAPPPRLSPPPNVPAASTSRPRTPPIVQEIDGSPVTSQDAEILRLVAADTPSHRGAWNKDSKAWQTFVRRHDDRTSDSENVLTEDSDEDSENAMLDDDNTPEQERPLWESKDCMFSSFVVIFALSLC